MLNKHPFLSCQTVDNTFYLYHIVPRTLTTDHYIMIGDTGGGSLILILLFKDYKTLRNNIL